MNSFRVLGVLAGVYRGKQVEDRSLLTHGAELDVYEIPIRALCRIPLDSLVDVHGAEPIGAVPACPSCLPKWIKLSKGVQSMAVKTTSDNVAETIATITAMTRAERLAVILSLTDTIRHDQEVLVKEAEAYNRLGFIQLASPPAPKALPAPVTTTAENGQPLVKMDRAPKLAKAKTDTEAPDIDDLTTRLDRWFAQNPGQRSLSEARKELGFTEDVYKVPVTKAIKGLVAAKKLKQTGEARGTKYQHTK